MARNMAYIVTVSAVDEIPGKDRIVYIHFAENGYGVIADKSFMAGTKAVYCEVDSILPVRKEFEFLRKRCWSDRLNGFLIRNMKMCGLYSNGIVFRPSELGLSKSLKSGTDVTDKLGVRKYEPEADASPKTPKNPLLKFLMSHTATRWLGRLVMLSRKKKPGDCFPDRYMSRSDETNIQNEREKFDGWSGQQCYVSLKVEGQSVTAIMLPKGKKYTVGIFQRNSGALPRHTEFFDGMKLGSIFSAVFRDTGHCFAVQGEFCGPGIQNNIYRFSGFRFFVYTVKDITDGRLLYLDEMLEFCRKYGFETVPVVCAGKTLGETFKSIDDMQEYTEHLWFSTDATSSCTALASVPVVDDRTCSIQGGPRKPEYHRWEGIVVRNTDESWSFKVKSNEYQLAGL